MGASSFLRQHPGWVLGGKGRPGPLGAALWGRWAGQDGEEQQANFLVQKQLCRRGWVLSRPLLGSFGAGLGFSLFLMKFCKPDLHIRKGLVKALFASPRFKSS